MTTIILTIIGILLAAAAALMVIFYGGDAFNAGSIGAQANTFQNAGTNVISAVQLAKADAYAYTDLASLSNPADEDRDYLREVVSLPNGSVGVLTGDVYTAVVAGDQAAEVCARINKNLKLTDTDGELTDTVVDADQGKYKMGCINGTTTFFANA